MSLQRAVKQNVFTADVAEFATCNVAAINIEVASETTVSCTDLVATQINGANVTATTGINTATLNTTVLTCDSVLATDSQFQNPPTCTQVPTSADQLVNKLYVDNAAPSGGGVEEVSGTDPISPTVSTTLLSGTNHVMPSGTTVGTVKTIVNMNDSAFTRVKDVNLQVLLQRYTVNVMRYDSATERIYVGGQFTTINSVPNTRNLAYYDLVAETWNAVGVPVFTTNSFIYDILVKGTRLYVTGSFTSVLAASGSDNTRFIAYYEFDPAQTIGWKPLSSTANSYLSMQTGNYVVNFMRTFPTLPNIIFITRVNSITYNGVTTDPRFQVVRYDESVTGGDPFLGLIPGVTGTPSYSNSINDLLLVGDYLYIFGDGLIVNYSPAIAGQYITTWRLSTQTFVDNNVANNLSNFVTSVLPYTWNTVSGYLILGGFLTFSNALVENIAFIPSLADPMNITMQQFPAAVSTQGGLIPLKSGVTPASRLFLDNDGTLYLTGTTINTVNLSPDVTAAQNEVVVGANGKAAIYFDVTLQRWRVLTSTLQVNCMTVTNVSNKLWFGTELVVQFSPPTRTGAPGGVVFASNMLVQLDKDLLQDVSGTFVANTNSRVRFLFVYKGQTLTFVNVDNNRWVLIGASSGLVNIGSQNQQQTGAVFFA